MSVSRRDIVKTGAGAAAAAGALGMLATRGDAAEEKKPMVAACGLSCTACPLMKAGKCKGCGPGNAVSADMVAKKNCPVLSCASMKKIEYCGTGCKKFMECGKVIGRPYAKEFMEGIKKRMA